VEEQILTCREQDSSIRIGVVGHRLDRLTRDDALALEERICDVMVQLQRALDGVKQGIPKGDPRVVTSLAEGADRIVAKKAVDLGLLETVVLPFPRSRFERDFSSDESRREFHELLDAAASIIEPSHDSIGAEEAYEAASSIIIGCADLLIAVWNGKPGRGPGGTAHTIDRAIQNGVPVIWIGSHCPYTVQVINPSSALAGPLVANALAQLQFDYETSAPPDKRNKPDCITTLVS